MATSYRATTMLAILLMLYSCEEGDPSLLVTVKHHGNTVAQASIYLKLGVSLDQQVVMDQYDLMQRADGSGEAYFKGLPAGHYTVYSKGRDSQENNIVVEGLTEINVPDTPGYNSTHIVVVTN